MKNGRKWYGSYIKTYTSNRLNIPVWKIWAMNNIEKFMLTKMNVVFMVKNGEYEKKISKQILKKQ